MQCLSVVNLSLQAVTVKQFFFSFLFFFLQSQENVHKPNSLFLLTCKRRLVFLRMFLLQLDSQPRPQLTGDRTDRSYCVGTDGIVRTDSV